MKDSTLLDHPREDTFERYLLHQSSEFEIAVVETHFLACESCTAQLEQIELRILMTKLALQELHKEKEKVAQSFARQRAKRIGWFSLPGLCGAGALAALLLTVSVPEIQHRENKAVNVALTAYRGLESRVVPKDRVLHLTLNANGLDGNLASVTLVDSDGQEIWKTTAGIRNDIVAIDVPRIDKTGTHFFRLSPANDAALTLREFVVDFE